MTEKKQKVLAREYFTNSPLFKVDVLAGIESSATSSNVEYRLTCKKCSEVFTRKGNARKLRTCAGCKREWDRDNNTIVEVEKVEGGGNRTSPRLAKKLEDSDEEPVSKKGKVKPVLEESDEEPIVEKVSKKPRTKPVLEESDEEPIQKAVKKVTNKKAVVEDSDEEEPVNETPPHDVDILAKILTGEIKPKTSQNKPKKLKQELKDGEHWVEEILDYYDDYEDSRWYRFYYVKWWKDDNNTFIRADKFTDDKMLKEYESGLPTVERFRNVFPNPKITKRTGKEKVGYRTKEDVEKAMKDDEVVEEPTREKLQVDVVYMKAGERYFDLKSKTLFLLEGDKDNDKVVVTLI